MDNNNDVYVETTCERCKSGFMRYIGKRSEDNEELYVHRCTRCGFLYAYKEMFPVKINN